MHHDGFHVEKPAGLSPGCESECIIGATIKKSEFPNHLNQTIPFWKGFQRLVNAHASGVWHPSHECWAERGDTVSPIAS